MGVVAMVTPDFRGFEMEPHIDAVGGRITILQFSRTDRELQLWRQIQVTLVSARLVMADVKIGEFFPPLRSCDISKKPSPRGELTQVAISFESGSLVYECDEAVCCEFSRKVRFSPESDQ
jgi:hypothetical protein